LSHVAVLLALLLHQSPGIVSTVLDMGGIDAVAVVTCESQWNERAWRREPDGSSWGLFQLYDKFHPQYRDDLLLHIATGCEFLDKCKAEAHGNFREAVSLYNSGTLYGNPKWAKYVERKRDWLAEMIAIDQGVMIGG
jgi:hypothetical protein